MDATTKNIRFLRKNKDYTQEYIANYLKVSRPTYVQIEKGERDLSLAEAQKLAKLYGLSLEAFIEGQNIAEPEIVISREKKKDASFTTTQKSLRISVPQSHLDKFKEVLLYILEKVGSRPNIGQVVLYKLLYFIDFDYYEKYEEQLIGAKYIKNHYGPTPVEFKKIIEQMTTKGEVEVVKSRFFKYPQTKYLPRRAARLSLLNAQEIQMIDEVIGKYGNRTATELSELTHRDVPWMTAEEQKPIDYESVFYRTPEFSVRTYDDSESPEGE